MRFCVDQPSLYLCVAPFLAKVGQHALSMLPLQDNRRYDTKIACAAPQARVQVGET